MQLKKVTTFHEDHNRLFLMALYTSFEGESAIVKIYLYS